MWSIWRCVSRISRRRIHGGTAVPKARRPVPASRTNTVPSAPCTCTQEVLPPYPAISIPGADNEPRVPQSVIFIADQPPRRPPQHPKTALLDQSAERQLPGFGGEPD